MLGVTAVVLVAAFAALPRVTFDSNPIHLRDPNSESVSTLLELAAAGEAPLLNLVAVAPDHATARGWAAALRGLPEVRSVTTTDALVPAEQDEKLAVLEDLDAAHGPRVRASSSARARGPAALAAALGRARSGERGRRRPRERCTTPRRAYARGSRAAATRPRRDACAGSTTR